MKETINLENAKALHVICEEKGVEMRGSANFWVDYTDGNSDPAWNLNNNHIGYKNYIPAHTTNELLEWLPEFCSVLKINKKGYSAHQDGLGGTGAVVMGETPQDALCLLLIELISKGLIK